MRRRSSFRLRSSLMLLAVGLASTMSGCQTWHREPIGPSLEALRPRDELQLWVAGRAYDVHGVVVQGDSVSAVPRLQAPECARCTLHFPLTSIDSVRVRAYSRAQTQQLGRVALAGTLVAFVGLFMFGFALLL